MKGFIVYSTYKSSEEETQIELFGKLENGHSFVSIHDLTPYFFLEKRYLKKVKPLLSNYNLEMSSLKTFSGKPVVKISSKSQAAINKLAPIIHKKDINTFEADIRPQFRFLIDNDIQGPIEIPDSEEYQTAEKVDRIYQNPIIKPSNYVPDLKVISLDIESDKTGEELYCIGLYGSGYKRCFLKSSSNKKIPNTVNCSDEHDLLEKFKSELLKIDPDIITGWHVIDFDLAFLKQKFAKNKISFDIGRNNVNPRIKIESGFFRSSTADIPGRQVLDGLNMIRDPFVSQSPLMRSKKLDSYTLENASQALLGEGKILKGKGRHEEISILFKKNQKKLVEYNLKDCQLAYNILEKSKIVSLAIERASLTGMPLNKISSSIAAFDSLYIREARKRKLVSPSTHYIQKPERITGGFVMDSVPGLYHNLIVLDFKSLYPSIIKTFNIDPASHIEKPEKDSITAPNNANFKNTSGILPDIIDKLHQAREEAKANSKDLSSYAIKIIMNSFFGVLASPNCRYFSLDIANAITHFGQYLIKLTAEKISDSGFNVIYSDTDSIFLETHQTKTKAKKTGKQIEKNINAFYNKFVKEKYNRQSFLELEFEKLYLSFMMPPTRGTGMGSKKRYAGLLETSKGEKIEVTGLEAIRGDWTEAAQEFQIHLLKKVFKKQEFVKYIKDYVRKIQSGELDDKLIYKKSLTKPLEEYTKTTPPHVKAARKLDKLESRYVEYYITTNGPEPKQKLKHKLDYEHYINKQIAPIANTILFFFHKDFQDIIATSKQMKLF
jgi:DNA polymerase II